ncbi:MAG: VUT family protein [Lachnospiraceae bacterium]|nr:VUT family protein [Lachnospiraceae bacterium]
MNIVKNELKDLKILLRSIPGGVFSLFCISVIVMNLLANKELFSTPYLALDCGFVVSWVSFLCMDMICKHFGPKAAVKVSIAALLTNLGVCILFKLMCLTPGMWGEYYTYGTMEVNDALNATIGGSWYVVLGSSVAMLVSAIVNAAINHGIGSHLKDDNFRSFALRSYISTGIAQFVDNLVFALIVSHVFFGWTWLQVFTCSLTGAIMELLCEVFLSPVGYRVVVRWKKERVGAAYLEPRTFEEYAK